jgi:hypothetical protein
VTRLFSISSDLIWNIIGKKKQHLQYKKEFNIAKSDWEKIYLNKVKLLQDKKIAEFN